MRELVSKLQGVFEMAERGKLAWHFLASKATLYATSCVVQTGYSFFLSFSARRSWVTGGRRFGSDRQGDTGDASGGDANY